MDHDSNAYHRRLTGSVRGAGHSDVLVVQLEPIQIPWLVDELEALRGPLEEAWQRASAAFASSHDDENARELDERVYELKLVRMMRAGLPSPPHDRPVTFVGPSGLVSQLVRGAMQNAAATLAELVAGRRPAGASEGKRLAETAEAAGAWVQTFLDCRAVAWFNFEPSVDPLAAW